MKKNFTFVVGLGLLVSASAFATQTINGIDTNTAATAANPVPVVVEGAPSGTTDENLKQVNGATVNVGTGAASTGTQRVTTSTDSTIGTITNPVTVTDGAGALNVIVDSSALPTGASTAANDTAVQGPVTPATATATKTIVIGCQAASGAVTFTNGQQGYIPCSLTGALFVGGGIADAATDAGNPLKIGTVYNSSIPTYTTGQRANAQSDSHGDLKTCVTDTTGACVNPATPVSTVFSPAGTQITASATGASTSNVAATLAGTSLLTTYISGFDVTCLAEATTAANTTITVAGLVTGTQTYEFTEATLQQSVKTRTFPQPIPASTTNTSIVITLVGVTGGGTCSVNAEGFQL